MKKRLAIQPDYQKIQIGEIDEVILQLKTDGTPEKRVNNINSFYNLLKDGYLNLSHSQISDEILQDILPLLSVLNVKDLVLWRNKGLTGATALELTNSTLRSSNNIGEPEPQLSALLTNSTLKLLVL